MTTFSVRDSPELQATILLYRRAGPEVQKAVKASVKAWGSNLVKAATHRATDHVSVKVAASGRTQMTAGKGMKAVFGSAGSVVSTSGRTRRRTPLRTLAIPYEFGGRSNRRRTYTASTPSGGRATYTRRTTMQLPLYRRTGWFAWPAVADVTPDAARMLVQAMREAYTDG